MLLEQLDISYSVDIILVNEMSHCGKHIYIFFKCSL